MEQSIEKRVLALERENRRLKLFGLCGLLCLSGLSQVSTASGSAETIRAKSLQITDGTGKTRLTLKTEEDGRPTLSLSDEKGKDRVLVGLFPGGNPLLQLTADDGGIAQVARRPGAKSFFNVRDKDWKIIWEAP